MCLIFITHTHLHVYYNIYMIAGFVLSVFHFVVTDIPERYRGLSERCRCNVLQQPHQRAAEI